MGRKRLVVAAAGTKPQVYCRVAEAIVVYRRDARTHWAHAMPLNALTLTQDDTLTGGLYLVGSAPVRHSIGLAPAAQAHATGQTLLARVQNKIITI